MSAKISGVSNSPPASAPSSAGKGAAATQSQATGATSTADSVQITETASHLVTAEQALSEVPIINQGRVAVISEALAAGTYEISPDRLANQLLQFERLLPPDQDPAE